MKIGIIVDGDGEFLSLSKLIDKLAITNKVLAPIKADIQPNASFHHIAMKTAVGITILLRKEVNRIIVLIDREQRPECPGEIAEKIQKRIQDSHLKHGSVEIFVVLKDRMFENWLIADPHAFSKMPARFELEAGLTRGIIGRADNLDALTILKKAVVKTKYSKTQDPPRILSVVDPLEMARNSRSFRRFLRMLDHPDYRTRSKTAAP